MAVEAPPLTMPHHHLATVHPINKEFPSTAIGHIPGPHHTGQPADYAHSAGISNATGLFNAHDPVEGLVIGEKSAPAIIITAISPPQPTLAMLTAQAKIFQMLVSKHPPPTKLQPLALTHVEAIYPPPLPSPSITESLS